MKHFTRAMAALEEAISDLEALREEIDLLKEESERENAPSNDIICCICGGDMKIGKVIKNGTLFILNENGHVDMQVSQGGAPVFKNGMKCVDCGHTVSF